MNAKGVDIFCPPSLRICSVRRRFNQRNRTQILQGFIRERMKRSRSGGARG